MSSWSIRLIVDRLARINDIPRDSLYPGQHLQGTHGNHGLFIPETWHYSFCSLEVCVLSMQQVFGGRCARRVAG